ncbi:struthiocalcin-1 isoform X1 [Anolis carolinensis]|uniref:C-type lectin domain-containing protein n=1 Tax=Anolis carolinensis TaxID=28377 RepID=H9G3W3_ANOCA|nr:PREDICTED: struthiocalcin-1 [Anolis carolinensis]|eukprot:XP_008121228.2 PREDICTED: struthiocalcin-1 [Anolis carolinensis]
MQRKANSNQNTYSRIPERHRQICRPRMSPTAFFFFSLGLVGCLLSGGAQADDCPKNWLSYGSHCYGYFPQELSWPRAQAQCQRSGGHLASILDEDEHEAVATYLRQAQRWDDEDVWIGLSIPSRSRAWTWADGSQLDYTAWEKNKSYFALRGEHCALLEESSGFLLWDNESCSDRNPFLCKV